ncbi:MAG: RNA pseudouridine synthase [Bacteroidetes bacterium RBG_13_46_8]|nr:MAG: RNA pseudouridine synthase [Bacteroidetes bacterium RBG_13_46_8]
MSRDQSKKKEDIQHSPVLLTVTENTELMKFLLERLAHKNRDNIKSYLRSKQVIVDGKIVTQYNHSLTPGQHVEISGERIPKERQYRGMSIVFEDQYLIVIDKHAGMLSMATDREKEKTAYSMLSTHVKKTHPANRIFIVHRLDRETSGLMVFAKSEKIQHILQETWQTDVTERTYVAIIEGELKEAAGTVTSWLTESKSLMVYSSPVPGKGEKAVTHYRTIKTNGDYSLLAIDPETGRKNQIRVHMKDLGHSIVGDKKYGSTVNPVGRMCLHARVLAFIHPVTREKMRFETGIPQKFQRLV